MGGVIWLLMLAVFIGAPANCQMLHGEVDNSSLSSGTQHTSLRTRVSSYINPIPDDWARYQWLQWKNRVIYRAVQIANANLNRFGSPVGYADFDVVVTRDHHITITPLSQRGRAADLWGFALQSLDGDPILQFPSFSTLNRYHDHFNYLGDGSPIQMQEIPANDEIHHNASSWMQWRDNRELKWEQRFN